MEVWLNNPLFHVKIWNHPTKTTIYKWINFSFPGGKNHPWSLTWLHSKINRILGPGVADGTCPTYPGETEKHLLQSACGIMHLWDLWPFDKVFMAFFSKSSRKGDLKFHTVHGKDLAPVRQFSSSTLLFTRLYTSQNIWKPDETPGNK